MNLTNHARCRMNQRAISKDILEVVLSLGAFKGAKGVQPEVIQTWF